MSHPRFSVVMPCYNGERYLEEALHSARAQTYPVEEIIVIDDGSTDQSPTIAARLGARVIRQDRQGPSAARNRGIAEATGDWIAFLDADDVWLPNKLALQTGVIEKNPECDFIYTGLYSLYPDGVRQTLPSRPAAEVVPRLAYDNPILPSTVVAKTQLLRDEPWSNRFGSSEDWDLFYRIAKRGHFANVEEPTTLYRLHPESLSHRNWKAVLANAKAVSAEIQRDYSGVAGFARQHKVDARLYVSAALAAREAGSNEDLIYALRSIVAWPIPGLHRKRHRVITSMVLKRLTLVPRG